MYTPWETHGARVVDSSNGNIMERSERFYERERYHSLGCYMKRRYKIYYYHWYTHSIYDKAY